MTKLLPIIIIVVAALVGGGGGFFLKMQSSSAEAVDPETTDDSHASAEDKKHGKKSKGGGHGEPSEGISTYLKFKRQFVVPVMKNGRPEMLMVFDINIEVDASFSENAYSYEPRLRDAMLSQLFIFANDGELTNITQSTESLGKVKAALLETARKIMGDSAREILLIDIGVQEY